MLYRQTGNSRQSCFLLSHGDFMWQAIRAVRGWCGRSGEESRLGSSLVLVAVCLPWRSVASQGPCARLLETYVRDGLVDYESPADDRLLTQRADEIAAAAAGSRPAREYQLAFWLNAYNVTVIASVVEHGPPSRVTDVPDFFDPEKHQIAGQSITLDEMEHSIIRPFGDARIHSALVCAATSCPNTSCPKLQNWMSTGGDLHVQPDSLSAAFLSDRNRHILRNEVDGIRLSRIFDWHAVGFESEYDSVMRFARHYVPGSVRLGYEGQFEIEYQTYDWSLNRWVGSEDE